MGLGQTSLLFSIPVPFRIAPWCGGCRPRSPGGAVQPAGETGGESIGRRCLRELRESRGANPRLRGRRPRPSSGLSAGWGEGSGRAPPAAAKRSAASQHSAAERATGARSRRVEAVPGRGVREGPVSAGQLPPRRLRSSRRWNPAATRRARVPQRCQGENDAEAEWRPER